MSPKEWCLIIWVICGLVAFVGGVIMERREHGFTTVSLMDGVAGVIFAALFGPGALIMFLVGLADEIEFKT